MQVKHILSEKGRDVVTITSDATLSEAARLMARRRIGAVVVRGTTARSRASSPSATWCAPSPKKASWRLRKPWLADDPRGHHLRRERHLEDLMETMTHGRFRHVPVVNGDRLVGIISIGDVVKTRIAETVREAESLRGLYRRALKAEMPPRGRRRCSRRPERDSARPRDRALWSPYVLAEAIYCSGRMGDAAALLRCDSGVAPTSHNSPKE